MFSKKLKNKGKEAYKSGKSLQDNPFLYQSNPAKSAWWESGWLEAQKELEVTDNSKSTQNIGQSTYRSEA